MKPNVINQIIFFEKPGQCENSFTVQFSKNLRLKGNAFVITVALVTKQAWEMLGKTIQGVICVLFVAPPQQEKIEEARTKVMQYRGLF
ncbi:MAG: hypothetical protein AB7O96_03555 [Pseudobdellovibrionaceae bacterium]